MKYRVELTADVQARAFVTVEAESREVVLVLAKGEGEVNLDVEWSPRSVLPDSVVAVDVYEVTEEVKLP